jgi:hypothetical protein
VSCLHFNNFAAQSLNLRSEAQKFKIAQVSAEALQLCITRVAEKLLNSLLNCFRKGVKVVNEKPQGQALCFQTEPIGEVTQQLFYFPLQSVSGIFDEEADGSIQIPARSAQGIVNGAH